MDLSIRQVAWSTSSVSASESTRSFEPPSSPPPSSPLPPLPHTPPYVHPSRTKSPTFAPRGPLKQSSLPDLRPPTSQSAHGSQRQLSSGACPSADTVSSNPDVRVASRLKYVTNSTSELESVEDDSNAGLSVMTCSMKPLQPSIPSLSLNGSFTDDVLASLPSPSLFSRGAERSRVTVAPRLRSVQTHTAPLVRPASAETNDARDGILHPRRPRQKKRKADPNSTLARSALFIPESTAIHEVKTSRSDNSAELDTAQQTVNRQSSIRTSRHHVAAYQALSSVPAQTRTPQIRIARYELTPPDNIRSATISTPFGTRHLKLRSTTPVQYHTPFLNPPASFSPSPVCQERQSPPFPARPGDENSLLDLDFGFPMPPNTAVKATISRPSQDLTSLPQLPCSDLESDTPQPRRSRFSAKFLHSQSKQPLHSLTKPAKLVKSTPTAISRQSFFAARRRAQEPSLCRPRSRNKPRSPSYPAIPPLSLPLPPMNASEPDLTSPNSAHAHQPEPSRLKKMIFILFTVGFILIATGAVLAGVIWRLGRVGR